MPLLEDQLKDYISIDINKNKATLQTQGNIHAGKTWGNRDLTRDYIKELPKEENKGLQKGLAHSHPVHLRLIEYYFHPIKSSCDSRFYNNKKTLIREGIWSEFEEDENLHF